jgi:hypothetical protein
MEQRRQSVAGVWEKARRWLGPDQENLDRALVAGLLLETILDGPVASDCRESRRLAVKSRLKQNLATHLAGRVTLDHFRALIHNLDRWFPYYYPLVSPALPAAGVRERSEPTVPASPVGAAGSARVLREEELAAWLAGPVREVLPQRPHRKLHPALLPEFLRHTRGGWFRIRDFEAYFAIDRKTAWEYLQKLRHAGLLCHNGGRSAAVRYCLADQFLLVRAGALRHQVAETLADWPRPLTRRLADRLIATGGEPFWEDRWGERPLDPGDSQALVTRLLSAGVLQVVVQSGRNRMVRLCRSWLQN